MDFFGSSYFQLFKITIKSYSYHTVIQRENLPAISYDNYGNTSLWWAIALFNDIIHPMQVSTGQLLKIPAKSDIDSFVLAYKSTNSGTGKSLSVQI